MSRECMVKVVAVLTVCAVSLMGCETAGQSAALGGLVGAGAGAAIGNQSGHAAEGALIGAAVGGLAGYAVGKAVREKRLATQPELEEEYAAQGKEIPTEPTMTINSIALADQEVSAGEATVVTTTYSAFHVSEPPKTMMRLKRGDTVLKEEALAVESTDAKGQMEADIEVPEALIPGECVVEITMQNGDAVDTEQCILTVV